MHKRIINQIKQTRFEIKDNIKKTSLIFFNDDNFEYGFKIFLKTECNQFTGSFKIRGVLNKINSLTKKEKERGVVAFSAGNHALSLACVCFDFNIPCCVVLPESIEKGKINYIKKCGVEVILDKSKNISQKAKIISRERGMTLVHPFDDPLVITGQGTIGVEILEELSDVDVVLVPIGGGGLIAGIAMAIKAEKPKVKIIGVESEGAACMYKSIKKNKRIFLRKMDTLADSLAAPCVGENTFKFAKKYVDDFVLVSDEEIKKALSLLRKKTDLNLEFSAAVSFAAIMFDKIKINSGSRVVCILTGSSMDVR